MKHLRKFEELDYSTYTSAAKKVGALGQTKKAEELSNHANKIATMGIDAMTFGILVGQSNKFPNAKFESLSVYKTGESWVLQVVFKSDKGMGSDKNVHRVNSVISETGEITWSDGNKFMDRKSVAKFQKLISDVSKFQKDFIKFLDETNLRSEDLKVVPRTFYV